jgi:hypothetical protein
MIRHDFIESLQTRANHVTLLEKQMKVMEELQQSLAFDDPQMKGWMPSGAGEGALPTEVANIDLCRLRDQSRQAAIQNPHGKNIIRTLVKFIIGGGTIIDFEEKDEKKLEQIQSWWKKCQKSAKWFRFQREYVRRLFRDGETIIRRFDGDDYLQLRFVDPNGLPDDKIILRDGDAETVDEFIIGKDRVPAEEVHFIKADVDNNVKRGRPILEPILPYLTKYDKWLSARMVLNLVRASVTIVQEIQGGTADLLRLSGRNAATRQAPESNRTKMIRPGTIIRGTPGVQYKMLSPNLDARDAAEDGRTILLAVAAAAGFPDAFVTSDFSNTNFASMVVAQNPAIREFEDWQMFVAESISDIVTWYLEDGIQRGEISKDININFSISFPPLLRRDVGQEVGAYIQLYDRKIMSGHSVQVKTGLDPDEEDKLLEIQGPPFIPNKMGTGDGAPPKRVEDRQPRQTKVTGSGESIPIDITPEVKKKTLKVTVKRKKEKANETSGTYAVECETIPQYPTDLATIEPHEPAPL